MQTRDGQHRQRQPQIELMLQMERRRAKETMGPLLWGTACPLEAKRGCFCYCYHGEVSWKGRLLIAFSCGGWLPVALVVAVLVNCRTKAERFPVIHTRYYYPGTYNLMGVMVLAPLPRTGTWYLVLPVYIYSGMDVVYNIRKSIIPTYKYHNLQAHMASAPRI